MSFTETAAIIEALQWQVLRGGLRLGGFDHWRERASSKPSDPDDIRWDCSCGYSGSPEKVERHWSALLGEAAPTPFADVAKDHDDRATQIKRIMAALSEHIATLPRHEHDEPGTWRAFIKPGTYSDLAAALYDAGLRSALGSEK